MNNCKLYPEKNIQIPQNQNTFYTIQKSFIWKNSIEIKFNLDQEIDYLNLYFILKSYSLNTINPVFGLSLCFKDLKSKLVIVQNENNSFIKKMNYASFIDWISYRIANDWKYEKSENFMYIILMFNKNLTILNNNKYSIDVLDAFLPIYPWTEEWYDYFKKNIDTIEILKNKNNSNNNLIKILKQQIFELKKK